MIYTLVNFSIYLLRAGVGMRKRLREHEVILIQADEASNDILELHLDQINSMLRAMHLWFHSAHNVVHGTSFMGDHVSLYGKIYTEIQDEVDGFIERSIGLTKNQDMGCPIKITAAAQKLLSSLPSPVKLEGHEIPEVGRDIIEAYLELLEVVYKKLTSADHMTLGLDDLISSSANTHESYFYLLNQRAIKDR